MLLIFDAPELYWRPLLSGVWPHTSRSRPPYTGLIVSYDICPCCSFEYGFNDYVLGESFESWRRKWIEDGAKWPERHIEMRPPEWNAANQLANIGIDINDYRQSDGGARS